MTLEDRVRRGILEEASKLPDLSEAESWLVALQPYRQKVSSALVTWTAAVIAVLAVIGVPTLLTNNSSGGEHGGPVRQSTPATTPMSTTSPPSGVSGDPPKILVRTIPDPGMTPDVPIRERVDETMAATGLEYEIPPPGIASVALSGQRIVLTGGGLTSLVPHEDDSRDIEWTPGDFEQTLSLWYSDGGAWIPATIEFGPDIRLGKEVGELVLPVGIRDVTATEQGFVAWGPVLTIASYPLGPEDSMTPNGTLVLTSLDGAIWNATIVAEKIEDLQRFAGGYLAIVARGDVEDGVFTDDFAAYALWSGDLVAWTDVYNFGWPSRSDRYVHNSDSTMVRIHPFMKPGDDVQEYVNGQQEFWYELTTE